MLGNETLNRYRLVTPKSDSKMDKGRRGVISSLIPFLTIVALACFVLGFALQFYFLSTHDAEQTSSSFRQNSLQQATGSGEPQVIIKEVVKEVIKEVPVAGSHGSHGTHGIESGGKASDLNAKYGAGGEADVPPLVKAWRNAKIDWHQLLPDHLSSWERFGVPGKDGKLKLLVAKETQATDYLTRFHESGLAAKYGHEFGPLQAYAGCDYFKSACNIHTKAQCAMDQLCEWSAEEALCVDTKTSKGAQCDHPKTFAPRGLQSMNPSQCKIWVDQPAIVTHFDGESQAMFYHWWASWQSLFGIWKKGGSDRHTHFFVQNIQDVMFYQFFGLLSDNCWRRWQKIQVSVTYMIRPNNLYVNACMIAGDANSFTYFGMNHI